MQKLKNISWHLPLGLYSNIRYRFPARNLIVIGVTGTDGKTTVVSMIAHLLSKSGEKTGLISTVNAKAEGIELDTGLHVTTPAHIGFQQLIRLLLKFKFKEIFASVFNPNTVHKYLSEFSKVDIKYVIIESTSQGLDQYRLFGIKFDQVVYTNIKSDHLDYHGTREKYLEAKSKLIKMLKPDGNVIINGDDESKEELINQCNKLNVKYFVYFKKLAENVKFTRSGLSLESNGIKFQAKMLGEFNVSNILASVAAVSKYIPLKTIAKSLESFTPPKGRMKILRETPYTIILDFAHTPHALEAALKSIQLLKENAYERIITVFGCAGKRDKERRQMGQVSAKYSDITILTAEDPRDEKVSDINDEILGYAQRENGKLGIRFTSHDKFESQNDFVPEINDFVLFDESSIQGRIDAIKFALTIAKRGDIVYITGKGHEQSLAFGEKEFEWDDETAINNALESFKHIHLSKD